MQVSLLWFRVITGVGDAIVTELIATPESGGVGDKFRACYPIIGEVAQDGCNCGQLTMSVQTIGNSSTFPQLNNTIPRGVGGCYTGYATALIQMQLDRCVSGPDSAGRPPTCARLRADALKMHADQEVMYQATICTLNTMKMNNVIRNYTLPEFNFLGPNGNCAATVGTFWVQ